jgi:hypothetical protein
MNINRLTMLHHASMLVADEITPTHEGTMIETLKKRPGPKPRNRPKARVKSYAFYPRDFAAIAWFAARYDTEGESDALRQMIDIAMTQAVGIQWAEKIGNETKEGEVDAPHTGNGTVSDLSRPQRDGADRHE